MCEYCQRAGHTSENCFNRQHDQDYPSGRPTVNMLTMSTATNSLINFTVEINGTPVSCVVDSAAQLSLMDPEQATLLDLTELVPTNQEIGSLVTNSIARPLLTTTTTVEPIMSVGSHGSVLLQFFIVPLASTQLQSFSGVNVILGLDWLRAVGAIIDTSTSRLTFKEADLLDRLPVLPVAESIATTGPAAETWASTSQHEGESEDSLEFWSAVHDPQLRHARQSSVSCHSMADLAAPVLPPDKLFALTAHYPGG
jgi:hypothetical protein